MRSPTIILLIITYLLLGLPTAPSTLHSQEQPTPQPPSPDNPTEEPAQPLVETSPSEPATEQPPPPPDPILPEGWNADELLKNGWTIEFEQKSSSYKEATEFWHYALVFTEKKGLMLTRYLYASIDRWNPQPRLKDTGAIPITTEQLRPLAIALLKFQDWSRISKDEKLPEGLRKPLHETPDFNITFITGKEPSLEWTHKGRSYIMPQTQAQSVVEIFRRLPAYMKYAEMKAQNSLITPTPPLTTPTPKKEGEKPTESPADALKRLDNLLR